MLIHTDDGDLALDRNGVTFKPWVLHGQPEVQSWSWQEIRRVTVEDAGMGRDRWVWAFGLLGFLVRSRRCVVVVSTEGEDLTFETKQPIAQVRAGARRLADDVPDKIVV